jgi:hypothetical protein
MNPISPVIPGHKALEVIYAADQPEYRPLPAVRADAPEYRVMTRWQLSQEERSIIAAGGDVLLTMLTFGTPLQPVLMEAAPAIEAQDAPAEAA